ncbi:L-seryl-tRNA(Sec) selenium transferase [Nonomuraea basaltis]|uniref:L-seryl-tRNA(Sec) selenium transferase n=1 Tax=Nonomuraea basaltis TaxID=2495887 RepID=UPI00110C5B47|nr:L-seryl-tRNA(Sec) selenium transferase [Nonomuraea basaltis]TMR97983.1 L-seryl-tRNA(Sec) selenium transferase [Nonomuraea basaltis]
MTEDPRRRIPRTDTVLADPRVAQAARGAGHAVVKAAVVAAQQQAREGRIAPEEVVAATVSALNAGPRRVINASGVLVHTNLGRAPLSPAAVEAMGAAAGYTDVEFDLMTGERARRGRAALAALAAAVPEAEDVHVVNNNAAALVLAATALAAGREIVVSRGEMVEIGDGFRLPDLLESTGARLREVGTTNRTNVRDYAGAIGDDTGFVLKVHPSNFRVEGFTAAASIAELSALPVPVVFDVGSGLLSPEPLLPEEPDVRTALRSGAALVTASGDKLLGGPQAGLILGRADLVHRLRRHPLARALRVDKLTLAALEATLRSDPPVRLALHADAEHLHRRAHRLADLLKRGWHQEAALDCGVVGSVSVVGGGGAPGCELPSVALSLPARLALPLRLGDPAVVGRVAGGRLLLDLRSVPSDQDDELVEAVLACT